MPGEDIGIVGWQKNSFIDFPGTVSTVLFFRGCNLRCPYCHNPDIVNNLLPFIPFSEIDSFLEKRKNVINGVVLSGGEPTLHANLPAFVEMLHAKGFLVKLDTNGLNSHVVRQCKIDYCALDIKTVTTGYGALGYKKNDAQEMLDESIEIVRSFGERAEVRITVARPFVNDENIDKIGAQIKGVAQVFLQKLEFKNQVLNKAILPQQEIIPEILERYRVILSNYVGNCSVRGV